MFDFTNTEKDEMEKTLKHHFDKNFMCDISYSVQNHLLCSLKDFYLYEKISDDDYDDLSEVVLIETYENRI